MNAHTRIPDPYIPGPPDKATLIRLSLPHGAGDSVEALCDVLMERVKQDDLVDVIRVVKAIYRAEWDVQPDAARSLGKYARDISDEFYLED